MKPGPRQIITAVLRRHKSWFAILRSKPQPFSFTSASLVGLILAAGGRPSFQVTLETGLLAYFISAAIYILNDTLEVHIDRMNVQGMAKRPLASGEVTVYDAFALAGITGALGLVLAASLSPVTLLLTVLAFSLGVAYSAPKIYLKKRCPHKTVAMAISAALAPLTGASYYTVFDKEVMVAASITSSYIVGMAIVNDFRDMRGDSAFGVRTIPLVLGPRLSLLLVRSGFILTGFLIAVMSIFYGLSLLYTVLAMFGLALSILVTLSLNLSYSDPAMCRKVLRKIRSIHFSMQLALLSSLV